MSKHVCPKCHKAKKLSAYARHVKHCIPCTKDLFWLSRTSSGSFNKVEKLKKGASAAAD